MSQKLPVSNFEWIEDTSQFNKDFKKKKKKLNKALNLKKFIG